MRSAALLLIALPLAAQTPEFRAIWDSPEVTKRIDAGIEANRKGWATLRFVDAQGKPVSGVRADIEQRSHAFLFGANLFMLGGFPTAEENAKYEAAFTELFNYATAAFYWKALEPEPGKLRFTADSPRIHRRPPTDVAVEFARRNGITLKGHPLVWDEPTYSIPDWAPSDPAEMDRLIRQRIEQIAARYKDSVKVWDVVNEVFNRIYHRQVVMPHDFPYRAFETAAHVFPVDTKLTLNEGNKVWEDFQDETTPYYLLIQNLLARGARIDVVGLQCHFFSEKTFFDTMKGKAFTPEFMFRALDRYADFGKPLHITELTIPALPQGGEGEAAQAELTRNLYRLWFSHPAVEGITWWNSVDDTAAAGEDKWRGGLVRRDFTRKPAFDTLRKMIREEWHTKLAQDSAAASELRFRAFYGRYTGTVTHNGQTRKVEFSVVKGGNNIIRVTL